MKKIIWLLAIPLVVLTTRCDAEPVNLAVVKQTLRHYHDDGAYLKELASTLHRAQDLLDKKILENKLRKHPKRLALVFDIDETTLSNYPDMVSMSFGGSLPMIDHNIAMGHDQAIKPSLAFYNYARHHNVAVFFVTGRRQHMKHATIDNLHHAGYHHWQGLYFKPENYHKKSVIPFKSQIRHTISNLGYEIVETIGDQWSDLKGGYADYEIKVPNPFYVIP